MSELVVKGNALVEASYSLKLAEQRLILLAIIEARETGMGIDHTSLLRIHAHRYAKQFGIDKNNSYEIIKEASKGLFDRYVTYHDKNPQNGNDRSFHCRWVDKVGYETNSGTVYMRFTSDVVPLITRLESHFTSYAIEQVANLDSSYAIRLYELLIQWRTTGKTPIFYLHRFRQQLGVEDTQYKTMSNFKSRVLNPAIKQVSQYTDIHVEYEQHKDGRAIIGFSFTFKRKKDNKKVSKKTQENDRFNVDNLTDKQLKRIALHKDFIKSYSHLATGEAGKNWSAFTDFMIVLIKENPKRFNKKRPLKEYLEGDKNDYQYS